jgi:predicted ATPase/DNA-binding SARP family transcriptional activator
MPFQAQLFGPLRISDGDQVLVLPPSRGSRDLLAWLLLHIDQPKERTAIITVLWPEQDESRGRRALTRALGRVRRALPGLIETNEEDVRIPAAAVQVDYRRFLDITETKSGLSLLSPALLHEAADLHRGDLLEDVYDDWALIPREQAREKHLYILETLMRQEKAAGRYDQAIGLAQRLAAADPLRETVHQEIMRLYHVLGRPEAARRQYETCRALLAQELDIEPSPETRALLEEISSAPAVQQKVYLPPAAGVNTLNIDLPLTSRTAERDQLLQAVEAAYNGLGGIAFVEGDPGIGKTKLLEQIAQDVEWRGAQVLWGHCQERFSEPFAPILEALRGGLTPMRVSQLTPILPPLWAQVLAQHLPMLSTDTGFGTAPSLTPAPGIDSRQHEQDRLGQAFDALLSNWSQINPLVLILEDLHWADHDSLTLLRDLAQRLQDQLILIIVSFRGEEARADAEFWETLQDIDRAGRSVRILLKPLTQEETGQLLRRVLGFERAAPLFERRLYDETGGNPLFLLETLRALQDGGLLVRSDDGSWETPFDTTTQDYAELPLPPAVERVILQRLEQLPGHIQIVLEQAAVLGRSFNFQNLAAVGHHNPAAALGGLNELVQRGILQEGTHAYRFGHDKIWQVSYEHIELSRSRDLHFQAAQALKRVKEPAATLAFHFERAESWPDAFEQHHLAAQHAAGLYANETAIDHLTAAVEISQKYSLSDHERFDVLDLRESLYDRLARREDQLADLQTMESLAGDDLNRAGEVQRKLALVLGHHHNPDAALRAAEQSLKLSHEAQNDEARLRAQIVKSTILSWYTRHEEAVAALAPEVDQPVADVALLARTHGALGNAYLGLKQFDPAQKHLEIARTLNQEVGDIFEQTEQLHLLGIIRMEQGDLDGAEELYHSVLDLAEKSGSMYQKARTLMNAGNVYFYQRRYPIFFDHYEQAVDIFKDINQPRAQAMLRLNLASLLTSLLGDFDRALAEVAALDALVDEDDHLALSQIGSILGHIALSRGDYVEARHHFEQTVDDVYATGDFFMALQASRYIIWLDILEEKLELAHEHIAQAEAALETSFMPELAMGIGALKALVLAMGGQCDSANALFTESIGYATTENDNVMQAYFWGYRMYKVCGDRPTSLEWLEKSNRILLDTMAQLEPGQRARSLQNVPEHRFIHAAFELELGSAALRNDTADLSSVAVHLPRANAPLGRPLREDEWVEIHWTPDHPKDGAIKGKRLQRLSRIRRLLNEAADQGAAPTYHDLAEALGVSQRTIERSMAELRKSDPDLPATRGSS